MASLDIQRTVAFYVSKLDFTEVYAQQDEYGIVSRDDISIHFWACDDPEMPKATSCRVQVEDIEGLYGTVEPLGIVHENAPLQDKPWGNREFGVVDCDGNLVVFFEASAG